VKFSYPSSWNIKELIDCTSDNLISYGIVQPGTNFDGGIPMLRVNNIGSNGFKLDKVLNVQPDIEKKHVRTRLKGGEVLITVVGTTGMCMVVPKFMEGWNVARAIAVIRPTTELGAEWIKLCLQTNQTKNFLDARANTTVQKTLNLKDIKKIPIPLPPQKSRENIQLIIGSLDDKIELNRKMNQTLEEMAQALFKSWFVNFDPVHAKANATSDADYDQTAKELGISREVLDLFPDEFEESELGMIPKGYRVGLLGEISIVKSGYAFKSKDFVDKSHSNVLKIKDLKGGGKIDLSDSSNIIDSVTSIDRIQYFKLNVGDLVFAMSGNTTGKIGIIPEHSHAVYLNQRVGKFFMKEYIYTNFLYVFLMSLNYEEKILMMAYGSAQPNVNPTQIEDIKIIYPDNNIFNSFIDIVNSFFKKTKTNTAQIQTLNKTRDTLLPKLLSGELDVSELELDNVTH